MTNSFQKIRCPRCGAFRSPDLRIPCDLCHSKQIPIIGYSYGIERRWFFVVLLALFLICLVAIVLGAAYIFFRVWSMSDAGEVGLLLYSYFI